MSDTVVPPLDPHAPDVTLTSLAVSTIHTARFVFTASVLVVQVDCEESVVSGTSDSAVTRPFPL